MTRTKKKKSKEENNNRITVFYARLLDNSRDDEPSNENRRQKRVKKHDNKNRYITVTSLMNRMHTFIKQETANYNFPSLKANVYVILKWQKWIV